MGSTRRFRPCTQQKIFRVLLCYLLARCILEKVFCRYYSVFMNARIWTFHSRSVVMVLTGQLLRLLLVVIPVFHIAEEFPRKNSSKSRKKQLFLFSRPSLRGVRMRCLKQWLRAMRV